MERWTRLALYASLLVAVPAAVVFLLSAGPLGWMVILFALIGVVLYVFTEHSQKPETCPHCGATVTGGADQCPYCGSVM